jgi:uncharacterized membrane protein YhaH (DUF805 family)
MPDELDTNQSPEQSVEKSPVTSTPNTDKIQEISEFYQEKKSTTSEATAEPIIERSPIDYYIGAFRKYADFSGRARRSEFWYFVLFSWIVFIPLNFISESLNMGGSIGGIYTLISFIPGFAVLVRRLHDVSKSGWFLLIVIIPIIGVIGALWIVILYFTDSTPGANKYGPNPKGIES